MAWEKMRPAVRHPIPERKRALLRNKGMTNEQIDALEREETWMNDRYTVKVARREEDGSVAELSIRRNDRRPIHDWRHFQRIKNDIAGPEIEGFELYPAMSRIMDTSNQYYIYCLPPGDGIQAGFIGRPNLRDTEDVADVGAVQRALPEDWKEEYYYDQEPG